MAAVILVGYMRTSTRKQRFAQQEVHFRQFGLAGVPVFRDHGWSGSVPWDARPGLREAIAAVGSTGGTLVVSSLDRLSRSEDEIVALATALGPRLRVLAHEAAP